MLRLLPSVQQQQFPVVYSPVLSSALVHQCCLCFQHLSTDSLCGYFNYRGPFHHASFRAAPHAATPPSSYSQPPPSQHQSKPSWICWGNQVLVPAQHCDWSRSWGKAPGSHLSSAQSCSDSSEQLVLAAGPSNRSGFLLLNPALSSMHIRT